MHTGFSLLLAVAVMVQSPLFMRVFAFLGGIVLIRVLIVDDHEIVRAGVRTVLI
jgi:isoprenylcysteine carboxyl methyltransferase (ICMT) family protein YpbQ